MANKPKIKKERTHGGKGEKKRTKTTTTTLSEKKEEQVMSPSSGTKAGYT